MDTTSENTVVLGTPPSCVAFCPTHPGYCAVGTYVLHKSEDPGFAEAAENVASSSEAQTRTGCLNLYKLDGTEM